MVIFHSYVNLPEGIPILDGQITIIPGETLQIAQEMTGFWLVKSQISVAAEITKSSHVCVKPPMFPASILIFHGFFHSFSMVFPPLCGTPRGAPRSAAAPCWAASSPSATRRWCRGSLPPRRRCRPGCRPPRCC